MDEDRISHALETCSRGDIAGLRELFAVFGDSVFRICRNILGQACDADDAVQEVFLRVFDKAASFDRRARFSTWLYRLAVNHCLNLRKQRGRVVALDAEHTDDLITGTREDPAEISQRAEVPEQLDRLLSRLSDAERTVVTLREIEQLTYQEIADVLSVPIGTVMSRLSRARARLEALVARTKSGALHR